MSFGFHQYSHGVEGSYIDNMDKHTRDSLVELLKQHPDFDVTHIVGDRYRVFPTLCEGELPYFAPDYGIAVFSHTFVPSSPRDPDVSFRYYLKPVWEGAEFSKKGQKKLQELVDQFITFSGVDEGTLQ